MSSCLAPSGSGIHLSVALGDRNCRTYNILPEESGAHTPGAKENPHLGLVLFLQGIDLRSIMKNHAIWQALPSSSFGLSGTVAVSDDLSL
jgi:hypothetical protein